MKEVKIKYNQLLFLYAYLRQIDLSLDRSRWTSWSALQSYYIGRVHPTNIIAYLKRNFNLPKIDLDQFDFSLEKKTFAEKLKSIATKKILLKQDEILYCCKLLSIFDKNLESEIKDYNLEIEKLRIDIAELYSELLELMISKKDLNKLMRIEHYNQNDELIEVIEMNEFVPHDFSK